MTAALEMDTALMMRVKQGEIECLEPLLHKHRPHVVYLLYRMVNNYAAAEDLAQEVFLRVYLSRARYEPTAKFTTWLHHIATNRALNWLRDQGRRGRNAESYDALTQRGLPKQFADTALTPDLQFEEREAHDALRAEVRRAIDALPARQRMAVILHKYEGMDYESVAASMGCTVTTVKSLLWRAYTRLRVRLSPLLADIRS